MNSAFDEEIVQLETADSSLRLLQLTDCHIFRSGSERLRGCDTRASFEAVAAAALDDSPGLDLVLATGDLSQDGSAESYRYLAERFEAMQLPVFWLPGNHDEIGSLAQHLKGAHISAARHVLAGSWQIVMLDSTISGCVEGRVEASELDFLDRCLQRYPERHALVCLHHQAVETGSEWIDAKGLLDADNFRQRVCQHANVRAVLWGHVHQEAHHHLDGIQWMSTPSSCIQFAPGRNDFALGDEDPGYRYLCLNDDGSIDTQVRRVGGIAGEADNA